MNQPAALTSRSTPSSRFGRPRQGHTSKNGPTPKLLLKVLFLWSLLVALCLGGVEQALGAADLYMQDTPADTGVEPNPDTGPMYVSQDIWVRQNPISGYQPYPFAADPAWLTAISPLHQNPEYRDPKYSKPNYVYVRVRNRGSTASTGTERLRLYWAKASTGLSWPVQWEDYKANFCGPSKLYGIEITKPRKNAATATVAERTAYVNAVLGAGAIQWAADMVSYFGKQDQVHELSAQHGVPAFLPWHREMINRYEVLLRETDPAVTLLYWDWTTDPENSSGVNLLTAAFMGAGNGVVGAPFSLGGFTANGVCANARAGFVFSTASSCSSHSGDWTYPPPELYRGKPAGAPTLDSDSTVLARTTFPNFRVMEGNPHGSAHVYMGSSGGNIGSVPTAAEDPFFFLIHGDVDRLWAMWQRDVNNLSRRDPATVYSTETSSFSITANLPPWDGSSGIPPWTSSPGDYTLAKTSKDASIVDPPIYDTAPLTIPILQPGESCVIEIPWYPPNPADFSCFGSDQGHVCLLARIETSTTAPYGMTFAENTSVDNNTRNNNNIVWKNVTVQDLWPGPLMIAPTWLRNVLKVTMPLQLRVGLPETNRLFNFGALFLDLGPTLFQRWVQNGAAGQGIERTGGTALQVLSPGAFLDNILLEPDEVQQVQMIFRLQTNYPHPQGQVFHVDLEQFNQGGAAPQFVGGQRAEFNFNKLVLVREGAQWRYWATGIFPGQGWQTTEFNDAKWPSGRAELGYGQGDENTMISSGPPGSHFITTWFRTSFSLDDPALYRNLWLRLKATDGAVVYLNGLEVYRLNLPAGVPVTPETPAGSPIDGLAEDVFYPVNLSIAEALLHTNLNVLAVEVHQSSPSRPHLNFDLELCANLGTGQFPPQIAFTAPLNASLHLQAKDIGLTADAIDPDGNFVSVGFFADGQLIGRVVQKPYSAVWTNPPPGLHQLRAVATDASGLSAEDYVTIQVLDNLPPLVTLTSPMMGSAFRPGDTILASADASDPNGSVQKVVLYLRNHNNWGLGDLVGDRASAPFQFSFPAPPTNGHYVLTAVATDNQGAQSQSPPVHFMVMQPPTLVVRFEPPNVVVDWSPPEAILERAQSLKGPWQVVSNAVPPLRLAPQGVNSYFRVYLP